jgi:nucleoside-diphosphate-sugar epimerase
MSNLHIPSQHFTIYQNAWPVNFSLSLESFDNHIGGTVNLMNLCLQTPAVRAPARFYFSSSVSTCMNRPSGDDCGEDFPLDPSTAEDLGYARSKWVVEKICERAAERTPMQIGVLRIGQMVGDTIQYVDRFTTHLYALYTKLAKAGCGRLRRLYLSCCGRRRCYMFFLESTT